MSDEEVIKRRLIFDGDGTGDDRRFNLMLKMITKFINSGEETAEESRQRYDKISAQLSMIEHARKRSELVTKSNDDQLIKYQKLFKDYEGKIRDIKSDIAKQRTELEKAKTIKQNRIEYDLLAKQISAEPARTEMNKKLLSLQKHLKDIGEEKRRLIQKLAKRKKQFHVLSTSANQLQFYLDEDNEFIDINSSLDDVNVNSPEPMSE
ncbi:unnamed protein product [Phyllotreta striolata]|uniref:THO complex subunit 7 n=1 Tax=Phyllotreta striolata TaxID=444603 RepID=A0A9N9XS73_PHYSR|nr:unnamed protein product [Phyllotreta striolata]